MFMKSAKLKNKNVTSLKKLKLHYNDYIINRSKAFLVNNESMS